MTTLAPGLRLALVVAVGIALAAGALVSERTRTARDAPRVAVAGELGPTPGPDADGYIAEKTSLLAAAADRDPERRVAALISMNRLLTVAEVRTLTPDMRRDVIFVRFPGGPPEALAVEGTLDATMSRRVRELQAAGGTDADPECACIYAVVVAGASLELLSGLQTRPEVRLVDVADPPVADLRGWELTPLFPGSG